MAAREEEESGRGTFEVRSTRLTGVDQISEGEIIQGHAVDEIETKPPLHGSPSLNPWPFFFHSFSLLSRPLISRLLRRLRSARANSEVNPKEYPARRGATRNRELAGLRRSLALTGTPGWGYHLARLVRYAISDPSDMKRALS